MRPLPFHVTTGFADLVDRVHGAAFDERFPANGKFIKLSRGDRAYWYHTSYDPDRPSKQRSRYAGAVGDPAVDALVAAHSRLHADYKARKELASSMRQSGLPAPDGLVGELALKFQKVGLFQAGAVLVGFVAYQCYGGLLGARLDGARHRTQNIALGQDRQVALAIAWGGQPPIDFEAILRQVDPSFRLDLNSMRSNAGSRRYQNDTQYSVDLLTADARPDRDGGSPIKTSHLEGGALQPLDSMAFLIKEPVRSVLLHGAGAAIVAPHPARYAIHKILVSQIRSLSREAKTKTAKDLTQASELLRALAHARNLANIADAWNELRATPEWCKRLAVGALALDEDALDILADAVRRHGGEDFGPSGDPALHLRAEIAPRGRK